jgi:hypothetical protein
MGEIRREIWKKNAVLKGWSLEKMKLKDVVFEKIDFSFCNLKYADFDGTVFFRVAVLIIRFLTIQIIIIVNLKIVPS